MKATLSLATLLSIAPAAFAANFTLVKQYAGSSFFDGWDFVDNYDNTTNGELFSSIRIQHVELNALGSSR